MIFFIIAISLLLLSAATAPLFRRGFIWDRLSLFAGLTGTLFGLASTFFCLMHPEGARLSLPWATFNGFFSLRLDPLAAVFLFPTFFITGAGLLYGTGYWPTAKQPSSSSWIRFFYPLLAVGIGVLLTAGNGVLFLMGWEIMALAGYFLVVTERGNDEAHRAGYIYLVATHTGTLALFAMFALLGDQTCVVVFPESGSLPADTTKTAAIFLLALFGFGFKAGIVPLHIWLPRAHAAAPSHVSALMSGVMIKTGIYGILRITSFFAEIPPWWGWLVLFLGVMSGILGVLFAIAQHDLKRLLAYHSVENIGIILMGTGLALLGKSHDMPEVVVFGLAGALLHVINHGLFKGLLFLSAGSLIHATGSRRLSDFGGLLKTMPFTAFFFLGGAIAICGLPPLNGFVSEWLVYLGLLKGSLEPSDLMSGSLILAVVGLAMIGGLALLCFAKVFGLVFLGTPRRSLPHAHEAPKSMLAAMGMLFAACLWIGLLPTTILPLLERSIAAYLGARPQEAVSLAALAPAGYISLTAITLILMLILLFLLSRKRTGEEIPSRRTWDCGYALNLPRAQYSTSSFAEAIMKLFNWTLWTNFLIKKPETLFPVFALFRSHTPDPVLDVMISPYFGSIAEATSRARKLIQHGIIGMYLLNSALVICVLLIFVLS
ncbi:MAG: proton-conducting transporter membrane subunit [Pseudomonadota bacterium]